MRNKIKIEKIKTLPKKAKKKKKHIFKTGGNQAELPFFFRQVSCRYRDPLA